MAEKIYDIAVIGAGVCGAAIARLLSSYRVSAVLLEKCVDICFGVSKANSGIIHAGFHHNPSTLKARLEIQGNLMFDRLHRELGFPFKRVGIVVVAFSEEEMKTVSHLYNQGKANGAPGLEICSAARMRLLEPKVNHDTFGGLHAPGGGIIEPYRFVFALAECARQNGVDIRTGFEVAGVRQGSECFSIVSKNNESVKARFAVNAAGLSADSVSAMFKAEEFRIRPRKGEEFLLDRSSRAFPGKVLFPVPAHNSKGILVIPTVEGTTMIGPTAVETDDKEDVSTSRENLETVFNSAKHLVPSVSRHDIITSFAGSRPVMEGNDFHIDISRKVPRLVQVAGIQSPGLTASPAIAGYAVELLKKAGLKLSEKKEFNPCIEKSVTVRGLEPAELDALVNKHPAYGHIACRCETVSEAQIVEAIRKGHTTLDGIKFYTRAGMGRCQGGFCTYRILKILARETGKEMTGFTKKGGGSYLVSGHLAQAGEMLEGKDRTA